MERYEWDEEKDAANRAKHGFGFAVVYDFDFATAVLQNDGRYDYGEERIRAFGRVKGRAYCVVYTPRADKLRIISIRHMHEKEAMNYGI